MTINRNFYQINDSITAQDLAKSLGTTLLSGPTDIKINDIAAFDQAAPGSLSFQASPGAFDNYAPAGAIIITNAACASLVDGSNACLIVDHPRLGFAKALNFLLGDHFDKNTTDKGGVSASATIAASANIHPSATVMSGAVIGPDTSIGPNVVLYSGVEIGRNCQIGANTVLSYALIGDHVEIGAGCIIGAAGFGFEMTEKGAVKLQHLGLVRIDDSVSIGSGCAIDRGSLGDTCIGAHVMMDNLCHIAHNVTIGPKSIIAGQCGISGSVTVGKNVMMGGQVGVAPHLTIGNGAVLTAKSGVTKSVEEGAQMAGFPAMPARQFWREQAAARRLGKSALRPKTDKS